MMAEWEQVEYLMEKGYRPEVLEDGWVKFQGPQRCSTFHPDKWAEIMKVVTMPPRNRPPPIPPQMTKEEMIAARNAALSAPRRPAAASPRPAPAPPSEPARRPAAARAKADVDPLF